MCQRRPTLKPIAGGEFSLTPHFANVQAHYDLSDDFFALFLDRTRTYSCAYFEREDMTLEQAQLAKIDLALGKLGLRPGMTLLDIGCGWGATMRRAIDVYGANVIGLTLSDNQAAHIRKMFDEMATTRARQVRLEGWEQFHEPVDRIVSIGAFEHFGHQRYNRFFKMAYDVLPGDGVMLLHTIVRPSFRECRQRGLPLTRELVHFTRFILDEIFPGGWLPTVSSVEEHAKKAGFTVARVQSLQPHYARTLKTWAANLKANEDQAIRIQSQQVYDRYMKYLNGCADLFDEGYTDVCQFTLQK
ncbi:cyclopropane mycolic acid synthase family methyltransferase [Mycobacterium intracellulare]|uniref:cyclopropane mycolic acid synthase family methyltransferase n=1 Tax=Mycobacterium intracellulare TaxID=1767 RepID=UPI00080BAA0E|nr:cyclopropane mycolic acid synthase family methyltransferase [Mycobacterium intracellulare]OCB21762.1 SAM-dependent methyltransferase [Mycobacterium intracellulare subsp. yongonense]PBA57180.1 class I SAM-dependent methyltransferase [Mycobacterium intracellulare subsp. chimaera]